jgi:hypothetical protein
MIYSSLRFRIFGAKMFKYVTCLFVAGSLLFLSAASTSIGVVKSTGDFRVDGSAVHGNGTVFDGNVIETSTARSVIQLANAEITLAPQSRARVYRDRTVLEKGSGFVKDGARHLIEAATLRIVPSVRDSVVQIEITSPSYVTVATRGGAAEVRNSSGVLTASLRSGMALAFNPQAAAAAAVKVTGVIELRDGAYFLTDETTKVMIQLRDSPDVVKYVGVECDVTGSSIPGASAVAGASQVVNPITVIPVKKRKAGAALPGAAATTGLSGAAIAAIVGGVAVGGTLVGLAAAGTFSGGGSVSR